MKLFRTTGVNPETNHISTVFCCSVSRDLVWYCVSGSKMVHLTGDHITNPINLENINDIDVFTWSKPITTTVEFFKALSK